MKKIVKILIKIKKIVFFFILPHAWDLNLCRQRQQKYQGRNSPSRCSKHTVCTPSFEFCVFFIFFFGSNFLFNPLHMKMERQVDITFVASQIWCRSMVIFYPLISRHADCVFDDIQEINTVSCFEEASGGGGVMQV